MSALPSTTAEWRAELQAIAAMEAAAAPVETIKARCSDLLRHLSHGPKGPAEFPHVIWHYLADADIRHRDARYRSAQLDALEAAAGKSTNGRVAAAQFSR